MKNILLIIVVLSIDIFALHSKVDTLLSGSPATPEIMNGSMRVMNILSAQNIKTIKNGDNIQLALDTVGERSATLYLYNTLILDTTIFYGNATAFIGENALLVSQDTFNFHPRPILDFSSKNVDGFCNTDTSWRSQGPFWREITIKGSGYNNGKSGIKFIPNTVGGAPPVGLANIENCYIESFTYGINTDSTSDSHVYENVHLQKCNFGFWNVKQQTVINHPILWYFEGGGSVGVRIVGGENIVCNGEFQGGDAGNLVADVTFKSIVLTVSSIGNKIYGNTFSLASSICVIDSGNGNMVYGNDYLNNSKQITNYTIMAGHGSVLSNNTFQNSDVDALVSDGVIISGSYNSIVSNTFLNIQKGTITPVRITGNYNHLSANKFYNCSGCKTDVIVYGYENILNGQFPEGVTDSGTRTMINGRSINLGNPATTGAWNTLAQKARTYGIIVENVSTNPSQFFVADSSYNWVRINPDSVYKSVIASRCASNGFQINEPGTNSSFLKSGSAGSGQALDIWADNTDKPMYIRIFPSGAGTTSSYQCGNQSNDGAFGSGKFGIIIDTSFFGIQNVGSATNPCRYLIIGKFAGGPTISTPIAIVSDTVIYLKKLAQVTGKMSIHTVDTTYVVNVGSGGAYCDGSVWTNASRLAIKKNIISNRYDVFKILDSVEVVNFDYKADSTEKNSLHIGFIADVTPELLAGKRHDGQQSADCIGLLIEAVKELKKECNYLKSKIPAKLH
jgi:hypothetical protein